MADPRRWFAGWGPSGRAVGVQSEAELREMWPEFYARTSDLTAQVDSAYRRCEAERSLMGPLRALDPGELERYGDPPEYVWKGRTPGISIRREVLEAWLRRPGVYARPSNLSAGPSWYGRFDAGSPTAVWSRSPMIFDVWERHRRPWWAKVIAWSIAVYYAVKR